MIALLALMFSAQLYSAEEADKYSLQCDVELILRIKSRNGKFHSSEERPELSYLFTDKGLSPYMYQGDLIFKGENSLGLKCKQYPNGSTLCSGDSTFGQTVMTTKFELRPDKSFFLHQIGSTSSDSGYEQAAVDKITVGRCSHLNN